MVALPLRKNTPRDAEIYSKFFEPLPLQKHYLLF
jgi:hypothetical protein